MPERHTPECHEARDGGWPQMWRLSEAQQQAVLDCPDETHDAVRTFLNGRPWRPTWATVLGAGQ